MLTELNPSKVRRAEKISRCTKNGVFFYSWQLSVVSKQLLKNQHLFIIEEESTYNIGAALQIIRIFGIILVKVGK